MAEEDKNLTEEEQKVDEVAEQPQEEQGEPKDKHGNPGINREKYQRDIRERDDKIAELQGKLDEAAKTEEGRAKLQAELDSLKKESADKELSYKLQLAGCVNDKAAKAVLGDYGGDIDKLKSECPYLFKTKEEPKLGATGGKPAGSADDAENKYRAAMGLPPKKK